MKLKKEMPDLGVSIQLFLSLFQLTYMPRYMHFQFYNQNKQHLTRYIK